MYRLLFVYTVYSGPSFPACPPPSPRCDPNKRFRTTSKPAFTHHVRFTLKSDVILTHTYTCGIFPKIPIKWCTTCYWLKSLMLQRKNTIGYLIISMSTSTSPLQRWNYTTIGACMHARSCRLVIRAITFCSQEERTIWTDGQTKRTFP